MGKSNSRSENYLDPEGARSNVLLSRSAKRAGGAAGQEVIPGCARRCPNWTLADLHFLKPGIFFAI